MARHYKRTRIQVRAGWDEAGRKGWRLGPDVYIHQDWTPVLWDDEEDPTFHKSAGLEPINFQERIDEYAPEVVKRMHSVLKETVLEDPWQ